MDLSDSTITMDRATALEAFRAYRDGVRERHNAEDEAIRRGYRALAQGHSLLRLSLAIANGGVNELGQPRLAVAQSDHEWTYLERYSDGRVAFLPERWPDSRRRRGVFRFPDGTLPAAELPRRYYGCWSDVRAMVPIVPPPLRPAHSLANYVTLFEVAEWAKAPRPPGDPALLKHITGDLYAVVAVWDLTPLEQAVLAARNNRLE